MKKQAVKITTIEHITHDVLHIRTEKPNGITFVPGQATEMFLGEAGKDGEGNPFTFTSLPNDSYLEFIIKTYPSHNGFTSKLLKLKKGDEVILNDVFGAIEYKGDGTFIAGGAGVTPFISIFRDLKSKNKLNNNNLLFANKTKKDIILNGEFNKILGKNFINILSDEITEEYAHGYITKDFIAKNCNNLSGYFYVCGPLPMMEAVEQQLIEFNVDEKFIVKEAF